MSGDSEAPPEERGQGVPSLARTMGPPPRAPGQGLLSSSRVLVASLVALGYTLRLLRTYRLDGSIPTLHAVPHLLDLAAETALMPQEEPQLALCLQGPAGSLHEVVFFPRSARLLVDRRRTLGLDDDRSHRELLATLRRVCPDCVLTERLPCWLRADHRVAATLAAIAPARAILDGPLPVQRQRLAQLSVVAGLTEKTSRVSSWAVRTAYAPLIAAAAVLSLLVVSASPLSPGWRDLLRYGLLGLFGGVMTLAGMAAVRLTQVATLLALRVEEYRQILDAREGGRDLQVGGLPPDEHEAFVAGASLHDCTDPVRLRQAWLAVALERDIELRAQALLAEAPGVDPLQDAWRAIRDHS